MSLRGAIDKLVDVETDLASDEPAVWDDAARTSAWTETNRLLGLLEVLPDTILTWEGLKTNWINGCHAGMLDRDQREAARAEVIAASKILTDTLKELGCKGVP